MKHSAILSLYIFFNKMLKYVKHFKRRLNGIVYRGDNTNIWQRLMDGVH